MAKTVGEVAIDVIADIGPLVREIKRGEIALEGLSAVSDRVGRNLQSFGDRAERVGKGLSVISAAMGAAAGGAFLLAKGTADNAREIQKLAQISGASTDEFQRMAAGARAVGIEQDKLADIFKDVNDRVGDFMQTGGGPMADFFDNIAPKVGVTADQFARLSGPEALQLYADSLQKAGLSQQEMTFYLEAMASDTTALIPLLANGGAAFKSLGDEAAAAGAIMGKDAIDASQNFSDAFRRMQDALVGLRDRFSVTLMPAMTQFMGLIVDKVVPAADTAISKFGEFMSFIQGMPGPVLEAVGVIGAALGVGGPIVLGIGMVSKALGALVAATGPVGLFIGAASLAFAAWQVWGDDIMALIGSVSEWFGEKFEAIGQAVNDGFAAVGEVTEWVKTKFNELIEWFGTLPAQFMQMGKDLIAGIWEGIKAGVAEYNPVEGLKNIGNEMLSGIGDVFGWNSPAKEFIRMGSDLMHGLSIGINDSAGMALSSITSVGDNVVGGAFDMAKGVVNAMGQMFQGSKPIAAAQALINTFQGITEALKLPFPANLAAAVKVAAQGFAAVQGINSARPGSGASGLASARGAAGGGEAASIPVQRMVIETQGGGLVPQASLGSIIDQINEAGRKGFRIDAQFVQGGI
jgi:hypothetical protein